MKITVITDEKGNVIGTARFPKRKAKGDPTYQPVAGHGQQVHEIELPSELENVQSAEALHRELKKYTPK